MKKFLIIFICLLSSLSIAYMYSKDNIGNILNAQSAPTFQLPKGAKVILGKYNNKEVVWDIGNNNNNGSYVLMSSKPIENNISIYNSSFPYTTNVIPNENNKDNYCLKYLSSAGNSFYIYCPTESLKNKIDNIIISDSENTILNRDPFLPNVNEIKNGGTLGLALNDRAYKGDISDGVIYYWLDGRIKDTLSYAGVYKNIYSNSAQLSTSRPIDTSDGASSNVYDYETGLMIQGENEKIIRMHATAWTTSGGQAIAAALRPFSLVSMSKINFAINTAYTDGSWHSYSIDTNNLNKNNELNPNKLRIQSSLTASLLDIKRNNHSIQKVVKNQSVDLSVNANTGTNTKMSVILYDEAGTQIQYYKLGSNTQSGTNDYTIGLTGIPTGKYQVAVINEEYDASSNLPVESSAISDLMPLEIVEPHKLTYTKTPQSGASAGKDYEFSKNVNVGQAVGKITVNPQGVMPLTYSVETNGDNTYQNFEVDGLNSSGASSSTSLNVKIKTDAPDLVNGGLKAGNYKFCVSAVDANGDPTAATSNSKVCTTFTVEKTKLSVAFDDPNTTKKSMTDAATAWNETATATPNTGTKITYSKSGGYSSLIEIDSDSGQIIYNGNNVFNKVTIRATADDDPATGNDNYEPAYVEKEIVIYRGVNATLTPDTASSNTTTPTFTASQANVKGNGVIGTVQGTEGTPDTIGGTQTTYRYEIINGQDSGMFQITTGSNKGTIKVKAGSELGVGSYHFTVRVSDNWSSKDVAVTVNVGVAGAENLQFYETSAAINMISQKSVTATDTGVTVFATVKGSTNTNPVKYKIKDGSTNVIEINENTGAITIHGVGTVTIVAEKQGAAGQADAYAELTFTVTAGAQKFIYTDNAGNELPKSGTAYSAYVEQYEKAKTFQLYTAGNPTGSTVTYQLKAGSPTDVISIDSSGLVTILNATISPSQIGRVIVEATSHDPSGNYADKTIELPINITKASQTISFKEVTYVANGKGSVAPIINEQDISSNEGGASVSDTSYYISVDTSITNNIAYTNDGKTIHYDYSGSEGLDIPLHVVKAGNRNYEKAEADGKLHIMSPDENILATTNMGKIVYGDHFTISSLQDDSSSINVQYQFEVDNTTYISNPTINGNSAEFDALKYSGKTNITIKVTRTADGETPLSKNINVQVLPKEIEIVIDDQEKYKGEQNPALTYQDFRSQLVTWNGVQDVIQENDIKLSTTAKTNSNAGDYPIKGDANILNKTYPNYSFKFKEGTLTIKEDNIEDDWYHLEINDGNNTAYEGKWTNQDVNIISDHAEYINLSLDQSTWKPNQVTVSKEGETNQSFWMKKDSGAITKEKQELIKIDKTPPKVKGIKAKDTNNKLQDIINKLSGGIFFKPETAFEITTSDAKDDLKVSGTKEISYKVYKLDTVARSGEELIKEGKLTVTKEKASITISETTGKYKVCLIATDNAGNTNTESCHEVELKKIDVDVDKDGKPDFNDPDGDGCPDLNIKWKDPNDENHWIVINGDRDYDGIPDLNIDSDGDGKPDLNIDTDNDGKPDLNLVILKKSDWKPTKCVKQDTDNGILEEYCTGTSVKASINVDTDNDGIPNINIDNNGDMKADINISKDGIKPILNIADIHKWEPIHDYKAGITYDSVGVEQEEYDRKVNIDTDGDGRPDVNVDLDQDGKPDINIDLNGDEIPDIDIDSDGDGLPDINVDVDGDGTPDKNIKEITEWKPDKNVDGEFPFDTMTFDESEEPNKANEPKDPDQQGHDTDVKGTYYPGDSVGGANTGDSTDSILFIVMLLLSLFTLLLLSFKNKYHNEGRT